MLGTENLMKMYINISINGEGPRRYMFLCVTKLI